jgi:predicted helicase
LGSLAAELFLVEQDYRRNPGEELRVDLADALAGPPRLAPATPGQEERRIAVVLGNPPFGQRSVPAGSWMEGLLRDYTRIDGERSSERGSKWLCDSSLHFLRLAQWTVEEAGAGILGLVLPHTLLEVPTFRGVRRSLLAAFDEIYALDLHGNRRKGETGRGKEPDENVFAGVATGIAVLFLVRFPRPRS